MFDGERRPLGLIIFFYIISCGLFSFYWVYVVSSEMKLIHETERINPVVELLASILTCGVYLVFWSYKFGKLVAKAHEKAGIRPTDNSFLYAVLSAFLLFPVTMCLIQNQLNNLYTYGK